MLGQSKDSGTKEVGAKGGQTPKSAGEQEKNIFTAPSISLPKGGGAIRGIGEKFAANPVTGTGSMSVPIATSPGRSGFGPQLSLSYDSGAGNGPFGFGWSLSLPSITRKTDKGLPQYRDAEESDVFILSGAEDLVPVYRQDRRTGQHRVSETRRSGRDHRALVSRRRTRRLPRPPLPPAHRGALRAHRALDQASARRATSTGARSPRTTSSRSTANDANSRIADPAGRQPHLQLADLRDARRQGQRRPLRLQGGGRRSASISARRTSATAATAERRPPHGQPLPQAHPLRQPHAAAGRRRPAAALPGPSADRHPDRQRRTGCSRSSSTTASTIADAPNAETTPAHLEP